ncbi:hypothetical protein CLAFUW4_04773 [Fulvia fulva]|uniref:F-box domain-containing protein n=1 Tax=Passalora fulva TaxID=5499 RepID=A0A9Q8PIA9_PASFU|nr:uncharacterized protein CLAFUR5_12127 [Fulvia fulva]KAK4626785.1 hypothetical protein CLAFUR4_04759 [Fulvia fulva]KAK4628302.1 hypothetical protein CLAFUR0_04763 [Fulvia fulva]UJO23159.1 hypothetical protein CLAFUR5_12127 [Fulvia fulva]WPV13805.1 hypothetical protein CLAFUW4_04773 [Fulvia fulva]WPV29098.1 hypothetical protein CLAFUW7_04767 [Fulvia fulva]
MPTSFFSLPRELRDTIYGYAFASPRCVRLAYPSIERSWTTEEGPRYPEIPESAYPPRPSDSPAKELDDEDAWEDCGSETEQQSKAKGDKKSTSIVDFNTEDFLNDYPDSEDEMFGDDDSEEDDGDEDDDYSDFDDSCGGPTSSRRSRYKIYAPSGADMSLLLVNRQIRHEALPLFYQSKIWVFDFTAIGTMHFLMALPRKARENIKSIGLPGYIFMADDGESREGWSRSLSSPLCRDVGGMSLVTPFGAFLATSLPKLEEVYFHVPMYGEEDFYCPYGPAELHMLLRYGRIKRLHHVFLGEKVAKTLKEKDSETCFRNMLGDLPERVVDHRFQLLHPYPQKKGRKQTLKWMDAQSEYWQKHRDSFAEGWEWVERDLDFGSDGNVQAVITMKTG